MAILIGTILITLWIVGYHIFGHKHFCHSFSPAILPRSTFLANTRIMKECRRIRRIKYVLPHFHLFGTVAAMEWKTQVYERSSWSGAALTRVWERRASDREPPHAMNWAQLLHYKKAHLLYVRTCSRTSIFDSSCTYMYTQIVTWMNKNTTHPLKILRLSDSHLETFSMAVCCGSMVRMVTDSKSSLESSWRWGGSTGTNQKEILRWDFANFIFLLFYIHTMLNTHKIMLYYLSL